MEEEDVDDDLSELRQVVDLTNAFLNVFADLLDEQIVECLVVLLVSTETVNSRKAMSDLSQNVVDFAMVLGETFCELIILICERTNVDAAKRVCLRKRQSQREPGSAIDLSACGTR